MPRAGYPAHFSGEVHMTRLKNIIPLLVTVLAGAAGAADLPTRTVDHGHVGPATIEAYAVMHGRDGAPTHALVALRTPGDARTWGTIRDTGRLTAMTVEEHVGRPAELDPDGLVAV